MGDVTFCVLARGGLGRTAEFLTVGWRERFGDAARQTRHPREAGAGLLRPDPRDRVPRRRRSTMAPRLDR